jgi:hypothetical protein
MNTTFQFTRYLYEKEEVKISLITSILNKKEDDALFWAFELFYSGFTSELTELIWELYYNFYATMNPGFEKFLSIKMKIQTTTECDNNDAKLMASLISNFIIRPHTVDVFILRQMVKQYDFDINTQDISEMINLLEADDFVMLAYLVMNTGEETQLLEIHLSIITYFTKMGLTLNSKHEVDSYKKITSVLENIINKQTVLLSRIIHYSVLMKKIPLGKNLFIQIDFSEITMYETVEPIFRPRDECSLLPTLPAYKILPIATKLYIDEHNYLSLFQLKREKHDIVEAYRCHWEYHASFSPLWNERIKMYNGIIEHDRTKVTFSNDDDLENFYDNYGLEPDEQKKITQEKTIQPIKQERTWLSFYNEHKNKGIVSLEEDYLKDLEKISSI